jgi:hypothetical protein
VLCFDDFNSCLFTNQDKYVAQNIIQTEKHNVYTCKQNKKTLSAFDDKLY